MRAYSEDDYRLETIDGTQDLTIGALIVRLSNECAMQASHALLWTFLDRRGPTFEKPLRTRASKMGGT